MADDWTIAVKALWDGTSLETGSAEAAASLDKLGTAVETTSTDVTSSLAKMGTAAETEFGTTLPNAVDTAIDGPVGLTTKAGKFKAVGTELGQTVAQGVGSGLSATESVANIGTSLTGLLAPLAATGAGAIAAIGIGAGAALVTNIIKGVDERRKAAVDAFNELFSEIETSAKDSAKDIKQSILDAFDFQEALTALGGEQGLQGGLEKVNKLVEATGANFNEVVDILRGDINPANRDTLRLLQQQTKESEDAGQVHGTVAKQYTEEARLAQDILDKSRSQRDTNRELLDGKKKEVGYQQHINDLQRTGAEQGERNAAAQERAAAALERQAAALERINRRNGAGDDVA